MGSDVSKPSGSSYWEPRESTYDFLDMGKFLFFFKFIVMDEDRTHVSKNPCLAVDAIICQGTPALNINSPLKATETICLYLACLTR